MHAGLWWAEVTVGKKTETGNQTEDLYNTMSINLFSQKQFKERASLSKGYYQESM